MKNRISVPEGVTLPETMTGEQLQAVMKGDFSSFTAPAPAAAEKRPRKKTGLRMPKPKKMSQAELDYSRLLMREFPGPEYQIRYEEITLRLPHGTVYTPDWVVTRGPTVIVMVEVKGAYKLRSSQGSIEKFKAAVAAYPEFHFRFAQKDGDNWITPEIYGHKG